MKSSSLFIATAAAALLPFAGAFAQNSASDPAAQSTQPAQKQGATFESLDVDKDGRISKTEAAADANVTAQFSKYDQNGDGFIERAEVPSANTKTETPKQ